MKIEVKVTGALEDRLPPNLPNPRQLEVAAGVTPLEVLRRLHLPESERYLISVNGDVVPQSEHGSRVLGENDRISIMPPLRGG